MSHTRPIYRARLVLDTEWCEYVTPLVATGEDGIALYYHYVSLDSTQRAVVAQFYRDTGTALGLRGRVRVARDGVNVTVGGPWSKLEAHVAAVKVGPARSRCEPRYSC